MARILLVDDDQAVLDLESIILSGEGHEVIVAEQALWALDLLQLYEVDLIIVDVQMPRLDGFQFVNTIRNNPELTHIAIAFCTSSHEKDDVDRAAKLGADLFLLKPIVRAQYLEKITSFFAKNPPPMHPKIVYQDPKIIDVKIHQTARLISVSDLGVEILTQKQLMCGQVVELPSSAFSEILSENPLFKVLWVKTAEDGLYRAFLNLYDHDFKTVRKIQHYVQSKSQSAPALKYPKRRGK